MTCLIQPASPAGIADLRGTRSERLPTVILNCHPITPCAFVRRFEAEVERLSGDELRLRYVIRGDISRLCFPVQTEPRQSTGLWRHACCEAFLNAGQQYLTLERIRASQIGWS
ncbi:MAG: hypothetical protein ACRERU_08890 [Methylococcales bacterium]